MSVGASPLKGISPGRRAVALGDTAHKRLRAIARRFGYGTLIALGVLIATGTAMAFHLDLWSNGTFPSPKLHEGSQLPDLDLAVFRTEYCSAPKLRPRCFWSATKEDGTLCMTT